MKLPDSLRDQLKIPLGILLPENQADKTNIEKHLSENSYVITVGDRTTEKMIEFGLTPSLQIIDSKEKRSKREPPKLENAIVLYGQPNEGLVLVKITPEIRNKTQKLLDSME